MKRIVMRLLPWFKEEDEDVKDTRAELAVLKAQRVESHVRKLAESYRASGIVVERLRNQEPINR